MCENILELRGVEKYFSVRSSGILSHRTYLRAVDGITLDIEKQASFGLVGESGCGKTTLSRTIMGLEKVTKGSIRLCGEDIQQANRKQLKRMRRELQMVFQNPFYSLNPRMQVEQIVAEPMVIHKVGDRSYQRARVKELLDLVGLPASTAARYPHEFSGGQRQRIGIARSLALDPKMIICDEPVSALDVSIQAQILNLFKDLKEELGLTYLFISHNLSVVKYMSQRIAVMYLGTIVEIADAEELYTAPMHPYTRMLLSSIPDLHGGHKARTPLISDARSAVGKRSGCPFAPRCHQAAEECFQSRPELIDLGNDHSVACHLQSKGGCDRA